MERLFGKTILIGKEPGQGRLCISVIANGVPKTAALGMPGCVPSCVSRCIPAENVAHAQISVDAAGNMTLKNMKSLNVTYVNGKEIQSKRITADSSVELGKDRYRVSIPAIMAAAQKIAAASAPQSAGAGVRAGVPAPPAQQQPATQGKEFNIRPLQYVWNDYHNRLLEMQKEQRRLNVIRGGLGIFTTGGILTCVFLGPWGYILTGVGLIGTVYSFVKGKSDTSIEDRERITEEFQDRYVCPNPDCNKSLPAVSYRILRRNYPKCPHCKCTFVEK